MSAVNTGGVQSIGKRAGGRIAKQQKSESRAARRADYSHMRLKRKGDYLREEVDTLGHVYDGWSGRGAGCIDELRSRYWLKVQEYLGMSPASP